MWKWWWRSVFFWHGDSDFLFNFELTKISVVCMEKCNMNEQILMDFLWETRDSTAQCRLPLGWPWKALQEITKLMPFVFCSRRRCAALYADCSEIHIPGGTCRPQHEDSRAWAQVQGTHVWTQPHAGDILRMLLQHWISFRDLGFQSYGTMQPKLHW